MHRFMLGNTSIGDRKDLGLHDELTTVRDPLTQCHSRLTLNTGECFRRNRSARPNLQILHKLHLTLVFSQLVASLISQFINFDL